MINTPYSHRAAVALMLGGTVLAAACQPTVRIEAPREPITINLNVNVDAEVRVKIEQQAASDIATNDEIF